MTFYCSISAFYHEISDPLELSCSFYSYNSLLSSKFCSFLSCKIFLWSSISYLRTSIMLASASCLLWNCIVSDSSSYSSLLRSASRQRYSSSKAKYSCSSASSKVISFFIWAIKAFCSAENTDFLTIFFVTTVVVLVVSDDFVTCLNEDYTCCSDDSYFDDSFTALYWLEDSYFTEVSTLEESVTTSDILSSDFLEGSTGNFFISS